MRNQVFDVDGNGLAVFWIPLGESGAGFDSVVEYEDVVALAQSRSETWAGVARDFKKLADAGWELSHDDEHRWGNAYQFFESFDDAQDAVRQALYGDQGIWLAGQETVVSTRRVDWYGGPEVDFKLGGFIAGEEQRRTPNPFPLWIVAPEVFRAEKADTMDDILPALARLGKEGVMQEHQVRANIEDLRLPLSPHIESFAVMGEVDLVSEAWLHFAGRIEVVTELPESLAIMPWISRYTQIPVLARVWAQGAFAQAERSGLDIAEEIQNVINNSERKLAERGGPRKMRPTEEQLAREFGAMMEGFSRHVREEDDEDPMWHP